MKLFVILLVLSLSYVRVLCQVCEGMETCQKCYAIPGCAWCARPAINLDDRCFSSADVSSITCPSEFIQDEESSVELSRLDLTDDNQISISKATLKLRAGDTQSFTFNVRAAENFPLDLYMIVDLSFSLRDDLTTIKVISQDIADAIQNISTRFQVGFGTFVDKLDFPYISTYTLTPNFMVVDQGPSTCGRTAVCIAPFSYVHNVDLTNQSSNFTNGFDALTISTNADNPEGTFDAMAQAVLCPDVVGWRSNSRKILVVITDAIVHMAGDGILAGIVRQFPMECRTRFDPGTGFYTYVDNLEYDYPSLEQIRRLFEVNLVSPVFAVVSDVRDYYNVLSEVMSSSGAQAVTITDGSSDLIEALERAYENIVSEVRLSYDVDGDDIVITDSVSCPEGANATSQSCVGVVTNQTVTFNVSVTLTNCTDSIVSGPREINVTIPGYGRFVIEVQGICKCDCESMGEPSSSDCSGNGTLACGICECDEGWSGQQCNCRTEEIDSLICPTDNRGVECSGLGECLCGECQCRRPDQVDTRVVDGQTFYDVQDPKLGASIVATLIEPPLINGSACECDNFACPRNSDGLVCSGTQGSCMCDGSCMCSTHEYGNLTYFGRSCECNEAFCFNQEIPYSPDTPTCNGNGDCNSCDPSEPCNCRPGFIRPHCIPSELVFNDCFGSGSFERSCVQCIADNDNYMQSCSSCFSSPTNVYTKLTGSAPDNLEGSQPDTTTECSFTTADPICTYTYYVAIGEESTATDQIQLIAVEERSGCFPLRWWHLALILLGSLIILGIIILVIVKVIFMILDYKEVKHLNKSVAETDLSKNFNPLYQSPEVKYDNIAFGKE